MPPEFSSPPSLERVVATKRITSYLDFFYANYGIPLTPIEIEKNVPSRGSIPELDGLDYDEGRMWESISRCRAALEDSTSPLRIYHVPYPPSYLILDSTTLEVGSTLRLNLPSEEPLGLLRESDVDAIYTYTIGKNYNLQPLFAWQEFAMIWTLARSKGYVPVSELEKFVDQDNESQDTHSLVWPIISRIRKKAKENNLSFTIRNDHLEGYYIIPY